MEETAIKQIIRDFIGKQKLAVIATVNSKGDPESAVIGFGNTDELELIFETFVTYRKYKNLQQYNRASFVIGWDEGVTVQYEGEVYELSGEELARYKLQYLQKNPKAKKWEQKPEIRYFKVIPRWIRYSDLRANPWNIHEINLADQKGEQKSS